MNFYAHEKVRELEASRRKATDKHPQLKRGRKKPPVFGPVAAAIGARLRRVGEGLESWANPHAPEPKRPFRFDRY